MNKKIPSPGTARVDADGNIHLDIDPNDFADTCDARDREVFDNIIDDLILKVPSNERENWLGIACCSLMELENKMVSVAKAVAEGGNDFCTPERLAKYKIDYTDMRSKLKNASGESFDQIYQQCKANRDLPEFTADGEFEL